MKLSVPHISLSENGDANHDDGVWQNGERVGYYSYIESNAPLSRAVGETANDAGLAVQPTILGANDDDPCGFTVIYVILYSFMTMRQQKDQMVGQQAEQMKMMQWMMYLMPVMFFFMFNDYSSGLNFYYFISLFFSAAIMWTLRKTTDDVKLLQILDARYKENKNNPKKVSGLAARLEAMQKQQAELQRKREELERKKKGLNHV